MEILNFKANSENFTLQLDDYIEPIDIPIKCPTITCIEGSGGYGVVLGIRGFDGAGYVSYVIKLIREKSTNPKDDGWGTEAKIYNILKNKPHMSDGTINFITSGIVKPKPAFEKLLNLLDLLYPKEKPRKSAYDKEGCFSFLVLEAGEYSLEDVIKYKSTKSPDKILWAAHEILFVTLCICDAMKNLKSLKIAHHDLKPANIIITKEGIKLGDFGVSIVFDGEIAKNYDRGTEGYIASELRSEEQKNRDTTYNPLLSDTYSVGVLIGELISGSTVDSTIDKFNVDWVTRMLKVNPRGRASLDAITTAIGKILYKKRSQKKNFEEAVKSCKASGLFSNDVRTFKLKLRADSRDPFACYALGKQEEHEERHIQALKFYFPAARLGLSSAINEINWIFAQKNEVHLSGLPSEKKLSETAAGIVYHENLDTAVAYNSIGQEYSMIGVFDKAIEFYEKALKISEVVLGKNHPYNAQLYRNIGNIYRSRKDNNKAEKCYSASDTIYHYLLGIKDNNKKNYKLDKSGYIQTPDQDVFSDKMIQIEAVAARMSEETHAGDDDDDVIVERSDKKSSIGSNFARFSELNNNLATKTDSIKKACLMLNIAVEKYNAKSTKKIIPDVAHVEKLVAEFIARAEDTEKVLLSVVKSLSN
jgi:serine/threonine protein kinase